MCLLFFPHFLHFCSRLFFNCACILFAFFLHFFFHCFLRFGVILSACILHVQAFFKHVVCISNTKMTIKSAQNRNDKQMQKTHDKKMRNLCQTKMAKYLFLIFQLQAQDFPNTSGLSSPLAMVLILTIMS